MRSERRREPWPLALAALLAAMIGVSLGFFAIAATHPDPPLAVGAPPPDDASGAGAP